MNDATNISELGEAIYPHLNRPDVKFNENGEYKVNLKIPEAKATHSFPKIIWVWAPTPAAPTVFATVLIVKIAAKGRLIFPLRSAMIFPTLVPSFSKTVT